MCLYWILHVLECFFGTVLLQCEEIVPRNGWSQERKFLFICFLIRSPDITKTHSDLCWEWAQESWAFKKSFPQWNPWSGLRTSRGLLDSNWQPDVMFLYLSFWPHYHLNMIRSRLAFMGFIVSILIWKEESVNGGIMTWILETWYKGAISLHFGSHMIDWHRLVVPISRVGW